MTTITTPVDTRHRRISFRRLFLALALVLAGVAACGGDDTTGGPVRNDTVGESDDGNGRVAGSGTPLIDTRVVDGFEHVVLTGEGSVVITFGDSEALLVETDDNLIELIETTVEDGALEIRTTDGVDIEPTNSVRYRITATDLVTVELAGAGSIDVEPWSADEPRVVLSGAGDISIQRLDAEILSVEHTGVGSITVDGDVREQDIVISGIGQYAAADLRSSTASVAADGVTEATIWVSESLRVDASGTAMVSYYGSPDVTQDISGLASLEALGAK
jgi:hypothetical protein